MAMRGVVLAFGFLTRLPVPRVDANTGDFATAVRCYPLVGIAIGALVAGAAWLGLRLDPWIGAFAALAMWVGITGALHLDGLSDLADGIGAAHSDRDRLLTVMADPHIGSFGVVSIVLQLLAKLVLLHALPAPSLIGVVAIPFAARIGPLWWARFLPPLKSTGLGSAIASSVRMRDLAGWSALLTAASVAVPALLVTPVLVAAYGWWLKLRIGGITGDAHGAGIEFVESGLLLALVIASHL
jgi:adenosylcobinamide-GDP ribazoletransferase